MLHFKVGSDSFGVSVPGGACSHSFPGKSLLQISKVREAKTLAHLSGVLLVFTA